MFHTEWPVFLDRSYDAGSRHQGQDYQCTEREATPQNVETHLERIKYFIITQYKVTTCISSFFGVVYFKVYKKNGRFVEF